MLFRSKIAAWADILSRLGSGPFFPVYRPFLPVASSRGPHYMSDTTAKKARPVWYNLNLLNLPVPGLVSIFHRISGALLFVGLIWLLFLLDMSLSSEADFDRFKSYVSLPIVKLALLVILWSYLHHFCAGIRYLDRKSTRLNSSHSQQSRMPSSA